MLSKARLKEFDVFKKLAFGIYNLDIYMPDIIRGVARDLQYQLPEPKSGFDTFFEDFSLKLETLLDKLPNIQVEFKDEQFFIYVGKHHISYMLDELPEDDVLIKNIYSYVDMDKLVFSLLKPFWSDINDSHLMFFAKMIVGVLTKKQIIPINWQENLQILQEMIESDS